MYGKPTNPTLLKKKCSIQIRRYLKRSTIRLCDLVSANQAGVEKDNYVLSAVFHTAETLLCVTVLVRACVSEPGLSFGLDLSRTDI